MLMKSPFSEALVTAVIEQTAELDELGGFSGDAEQTQYVRDVREVARKLRIAETVIASFHNATAYASELAADACSTQRNAEGADAALSATKGANDRRRPEHQ